MMRTFSALALGAMLAGQGFAACPGGGCGPLGRLLAPRGGAIDGAGPVEVIDVTFNFAWLTPHGGYTTYPGLPGSGYGTHSDYSQHNWLVSPEENAAMVRNRLRELGIPPVPPEPVFLGKNPRAADNIKLPLPRVKEKDKDDDK